MGFETRFNKFAGLLNYLTVHLIIALVVFLVRLGDKSFLTYYRSRIFAERRWLQRLRAERRGLNTLGPEHCGLY